MNRLLSKARAIFILVKERKLKEAWQEIRLWLYSDSVSYGVRRDLHAPFEIPEVPLQLHVRPVTDADVPLIFTPPPSQSELDAYLLANRYHFYQQNVPTCFVAVTENDQPVFLQWLIGPQHNAAVQRYFGSMFPPLQTEEALLEYAFTMPDYRDNQVLAHAGNLIAEQGKAIGARWVIGFIRADNIPALKGAKRGGFHPFMERHERWRFFRRQVSFIPLPEGASFPFD